MQPPQDDANQEDAAQPDEAHSIMVSSLVSHRTGAGLVNFHSVSERAQLTPAQARHLAQSLLEAAEAAEQDSFLVRYLRTTFDLSEGQAAMFLMDYRAAREASPEEAPDAGH